MEVAYGAAIVAAFGGILVAIINVRYKPRLDDIKSLLEKKPSIEVTEKNHIALSSEHEVLKEKIGYMSKDFDRYINRMENASTNGNSIKEALETISSLAMQHNAYQKKVEMLQKKVNILQSTLDTEQDKNKILASKIIKLGEENRFLREKSERQREVLDADDYDIDKDLER